MLAHGTGAAELQGSCSLEAVSLFKDRFVEGRRADRIEKLCRPPPLAARIDRDAAQEPDDTHEFGEGIKPRAQVRKIG